jgi:hypothetical protein
MTDMEVIINAMLEVIRNSPEYLEYLRREEEIIINGTGEGEPVGILNETQ